MTFILAQRDRAARRRRPPASIHSARAPAQDADSQDVHSAAGRGTVARGASAGGGASADGDAETLPCGLEEGISQSAGVDRRLVAQALTIRRTEERLLGLFAEGKLSGTVHTCIGQEWVGVAVANALKRGDFLLSNHRGHGHYLAWTDDVDGLIAELMGRSTGVCGGRGGSQHLCRDGFFSNGVQGGTVPVAAGLAMARRLDGGSNIAVAFVGDGTLGQGVVYETLNLAAKWSLPLLVVVEDNGVAQSTERTETLAGTVKGRAYAFGIKARCADTWHPSDLIARASEAVRLVRQTRRPLLLHVKTYRLKAHSKGDDHRDTEEVASFARTDTLNQLLADDVPKIRNLLTALDERIDDAVTRASAAPEAAIKDGRQEVQSAIPSRLHWKPVAFDSQRVVDAIRDALGEAMANDERIVLLGEDIRDPYGGAFKVTAGLSERFGDRVRNTPISEASIVGMASGLALAGWRPVVEIMFGDFLLLAADQIVNHAAKFAWMYNGQVAVPIVIRTPMGGYRGYGPTHSQSLEKHLLGLPGTRVLALHKRYCPGLIYRTLLADNDRPTLVIENKLLYGDRTDPTAPPACELQATDATYPTVRIGPAGERQLTIVTYGGLVSTVESAIETLAGEELACDLLIPTQLYPLDLEPILDSVAQTGRLLVVEEGQGFAGFGSELIAQLSADPRLGGLRAGRVCAAPCPIPAARAAERALLPGIETITRAAIEMVMS